ncbi:RNA-directed DNA polymerase [Aurantimonas sp. E1-2-R+4]|uniref:RNA-directed DNA polymerase n=1 Tax=Aurantimonas sp. E1-2-R+4 TaxID=3113714 RepID=UPI002F933F1C
MAALPAEKADIRVYVNTLFDCLKSWCYSDTAGLPQNRDASSFLANVYMLPVDRAMLAKGYNYFRYMDDIKIACVSEHDARKALKALSLELRNRGLSVNSGKTTIVSRDQGDDDISKYLDAGDTELQQIDSVWQTRSLRPIRASGD